MKRNSYFNYLFDLGLSNRYFETSEKVVYDKLVNLKLTPKTVDTLIVDFNEKTLKDGSEHNRFNINRTNVIERHFIVCNILFNRETNAFNDFTLYTTDVNKMLESGCKNKYRRIEMLDIEPAELIFIGRKGIDKKEFMIPECAEEIVNINNISDERKNELIAIINKEPVFGMPRELFNSFSALRSEIARGVKENQEIKTRSQYLIRRSKIKYRI